LKKPVEELKQNQDSDEDMQDTESLLSYYEKQDALEAPTGFKDTSEFDESRSQGFANNENLCDEEQSNETYGRQRATLDAVKGPQLVETASSKKDNDDTSYDLFKQR